MLKLPLIQLDGGLKPITTNVSWLNHDGEDLPDAWKAVGFNDASWLHGAIQETCQAPLVGRLYLRGQFEVTDPAKVDRLALTINYRGKMGSRMVYVPLICYTNFGNEQSMVRWIKKSARANTRLC